ncbi:MAG: hypothetical protein MJ174_05200 [Treponema sp.]|nr:hypothetical protein [Treponema sp.]
MYGFIIKKSFCDDWDNLLTVVIVNIIFLFTCLGAAFGFFKVIELFTRSDVVSAYQFAILGFIVFIAFYIMNIINFAFGEIAAEYAAFNSANILDFFKKVPGVLLDALLFSLMVAIIAIVSVFSIWFYFIASQSRIGVFVGALLFWIDIFLILSLQWFVPIRSYFHNNFRKCLKKCFLIFFDNTWYSIVVFFHTIVMMVISVFPFFGMFPSISGITINKANAFRIRMYKYDYLEEHPELTSKRQRGQIPWEELIYEDRETLGPRKLKSFLFPWKEDK